MCVCEVLSAGLRQWKGFSMKVTSLPHSMEVGVCVEAYRQEAETQRRHINSAFMTFAVLDAENQPRKLPWIRPQPGVSEWGCACPSLALDPLCPCRGLPDDAPLQVS